MTDEEKVKELYRKWCNSEIDGSVLRDLLREMAEWKDEQPIIESGGWHTEQPTANGWYLVDTPNFPKNCHCVVAEWDNHENNFFDEFDCPIKFNKWKLIERW